jgi:heat-inducible transcriptional repressor
MRKYLISALLCMAMLVAMVPSAFAATNYEECMSTIQTLKQQQEADVRVAGHMRLLGQPEYRDVEKAQMVLSDLDNSVMSNLPAVLGTGNGTQVLVGPENVAQALKDSSVVMTKFDIGEGMHGVIGVVGPTRMDYAKVTARLSYFAESLSKMFAKPEAPQLPAAAIEEEA